MAGGKDTIGGTTGTQNQQGVVEADQPDVQVQTGARPRLSVTDIVDVSSTPLEAPSVVNLSPLEQADLYLKEASDCLLAHPGDFDEAIKLFKKAKDYLEAFPGDYEIRRKQDNISMNLAQLYEAKYDAIPGDKKSMEAIKLLRDAYNEYWFMQFGNSERYNKAAEIAIKRGNLLHEIYLAKGSSQEKDIKEIDSCFTSAISCYEDCLSFRQKEVDFLKGQNEGQSLQGLASMNKDLDDQFERKKAEINLKIADLHFKIGELYDTDYRAALGNDAEADDQIKFQSFLGNYMKNYTINERKYSMSKSAYEEAMSLGHVKAETKLDELFQVDLEYLKAKFNEGKYLNTSNINSLYSSVVLYSSISSAPHNNKSAQKRLIEVGFQCADLFEKSFANSGKSRDLLGALHCYIHLSASKLSGASELAIKKRREVQFTMAQLHESGKAGFEKDQREAFLEYETLKNEGHKGALFKCGIMKIAGKGTESDIEGGYEFIKQAAAEDEPKAFQWLEKQAEKKNDKRAQRLLGDIYLQKGGEQNLKMAAYFYGKADELNEQGQPSRLGKIFKKNKKG